MKMEYILCISSVTYNSKKYALKPGTSIIQRVFLLLNLFVLLCYATHNFYGIYTRTHGPATPKVASEICWLLIYGQARLWGASVVIQELLLKKDIAYYVNTLVVFSSQLRGKD